MVKRKSSTSFKTLNEVLETDKELSSLKEKIKLLNVLGEFENIFPELSNIAKAIKVEKQILFLKVENSVWKSELNFQKNILIKKINNYFKEEIIKSIKFL
ncbi:MAG: DUF721 domain-containing protein [Stygiobacter sp.]|jgi:hypothetical protein|uniref:DUF721 domain-containing protein n=1 Tax=Stygiobacter electus TaxID=3032292 RepID=A0AAE3P0D4_9BACT|nr:DUF721 domain-containing protein [Stygiobacter electus]MDF1612072.1 DUF721 domain-containing protein [Stygiobacter electus]